MATKSTKKAAAGKKVKVTLVRSLINTKSDHRETVRAPFHGGRTWC